MIRLFSIITIIFVIAATPSFAERDRLWEEHHTAEYRHLRAEKTLQQLLTVFVTRPGVTVDSPRRGLLPAIHAGAAAFTEALRPGKRLQRFTQDLKPLLTTLNADMESAAEGLAGAEARGAAMDRLLSGILDVAKGAKIHPEEMDIALLQAAAAIQDSLQRPPAVNVLSPEDRELISLRLLTSVSQLHKRAILLTEPLDALETLGTEPSQVAAYTQRLSWSGSALARELVGLEKTLSDPDILEDLNGLIMIQSDVDAANDIFALKVGLESSFLGNSLDLAPLAAKISSMGGIMSGMTTNLLRESGAVPPNFLIITAYDWLTPSTPLSYDPDASLPNKLALLGVPLPPPPDFSLFATPYRDIFQLRYDLSLCDQITVKEWQDAEEQAYVLNRHPLTAPERLALRKADAARRQAVMARLNGPTPEEKHALRILLLGYAGK
ncbi:hypothetical protein [Geobacter sp.]|uniref:hypothetical protein n=1 Tax=Geobacter sp. TaxID=46610 RepID=UPI0026076364|nr:hypothetical protein [Geobacter sp.]